MSHNEKKEEKDTLEVQKSLENLAEHANKTLAKHVEEVVNEISGDVFIDYSSEVGITQFIIEEFVSENKISMVLLENLENKSSWTQNSTNMDIIRYINCPIWVIPHESIYQPFDKIVYATDYNEEDISTLKKLIGLTNKYSPNITALHVTDSSDFEEKVKKNGFLQMVQTKTEYNKITVASLVEKNDEDIAQTINDYAINNEVSLIVILKENRQFLERIFKPSSTKKIIKKSLLPVLVYHEKG